MASLRRSSRSTTSPPRPGAFATSASSSRSSHGACPPHSAVFDDTCGNLIALHQRTNDGYTMWYMRLGVADGPPDGGNPLPGNAGRARSGGSFWRKEPGMSESAETGPGGRRGRGGGGAARRAERTAVRVEAAPFIRRRIPNYEILDEEGLALIEANAETVLEEIGVRFAENPEALKLWREAGADVRGDRVHLPRGLARSLCATAPREYVQHARNPERRRDDRRKKSRAGAGLRAALRAGHGERPALCDDRGLPQLREARLFVEVGAPRGRHGLRADRHRGEQAAPRHAAGAHDALRQAVHGAR